MIDVREVSSAGMTFVCLECEENLDVTIQCRYERLQGWGKHLDRFLKKHDACGEGLLEKRIYPFLPDFEASVKFAEGCYAEDPKMAFAEISRRWNEIRAMRAENQMEEA